MSERTAVEGERATRMSGRVYRNGLIFALCCYGLLALIAGLIWG